MPRVFISYRHSDCLTPAVLLHERLEKEFGRGRVFLDRSDLAPGAKFREEIEAFIHAADVMLIMIGPGWLDARDALGRRRLDDPYDFVSQEIAWGQVARIAFLPLLIDGAPMPRRHELPPALRGLADLQGFVLQPEAPHNRSVARLIDAIWRHSGQRRPRVRRPRLLLFHLALITSILFVFMALIGLVTNGMARLPDTGGLSTRIPSPGAPRIVFFQADADAVVQGTPLTVRWQVDGASSFALRVDGARQNLLAGEATQTTLTLNTPGQHTLVLVAFQGEHSTEATLQVRVEEALRIRRFAADPSVLTRHIAGEVTLMWDVVGAVEVRLDDFGALGGQIEAGPLPLQGSSTLTLRLEEQTVIQLRVTSATAQTQTQSILLRVQDPLCIVSVEQAPLYADPGASVVLEWRAAGAFVLPDNRTADSAWLRVHVPGGEHVWILASVVRCRDFAPVDLPVLGE